MKIDIERYNERYHQSGKFIDNWQSGIKLLPFNSNPSSAYDKRCGLHGVTGEFCRILDNDGTNPIENFEDSVKGPVKDFLLAKNMDEEQIGSFLNVLKDVLFVNGNLNVTDSSFLKYMPMVPDDETISTKVRKKYSDGQNKLAKFLYSMLLDDENLTISSSNSNLFVKILKEALVPFGSNNPSNIVKEYTILPFIKKSCSEDITWLLKQKESVKIKYFHLLLHFYTCYAVTQAITFLSPKKHDAPLEPTSFYFILNSEKASVNHDAVVSGWSHRIPKQSLDKLFGKSQALDILNSVLSEDGKVVGFYYDVYKALSATPFEENKYYCEKLLELYQQEKREVFKRRASEDGSIEEMSTTITSYEDFTEKLERLCVGLQSPSYVSRMRKKVIDLLSVRFLQIRRGNFVLVLDNEMLIFLIAMFTKGKKVKLDDMYKLFNGYGIFFNRGSRLAIEEYLLKLNLLDRKSDSGEAQYVKVIL